MSFWTAAKSNACAQRVILFSPRTPLLETKLNDADNTVYCSTVFLKKKDQAYITVKVSRSKKIKYLHYVLYIDVIKNRPIHF
jgi:hypothetical protein